MATKKATQTTLAVPAPRFRTLAITIQGTAPYMQARFSHKAFQAMRDKMEAGSTAKSKRTREARDFEEDFIQAQHFSEDGWVGIPAAAFRNACIDACRMVGFKMTHARMSIFVEADGFDKIDGTPLVEIAGDEPKKTEMAVRNATGVVDIRARPMWRKWGCILRVRFDLDQFTDEDVVNLLTRAGQQVGVGEGRPFSKSSNGMGYGLFTVKKVTNV